MPRTPKEPRPFAEAATGFEDGIARICRLYGVSPLTGRLYAILFLSSEPLALEEICERAGAAKSTVSVALRKLVSLRIARRLPPARGDRRDFYEAVTDPWAVLEEWTRLFFEPELQMWRETGGGLERALQSAEDAPKGKDAEILQERISGMVEFMSLVEQLMGQVSRVKAPHEPARTLPSQLEADEE